MKKILIIDDEKDLGWFMKENLELTGDYKVTSTSSAEEGLRSAVNAKPDLIILDLLMPDMDGRTILEALKKKDSTKNIPVLLLTALDPSEAYQRIPGLAKEAYLTKPVTLDTLKESIIKVLKGHNK